MHIHISNVNTLLSKAMVQNWNRLGKYSLAIVISSILLSSVGILLHNTSAALYSDSTLEHKVKQVNTLANKAMNVKSPPHIPPLVIEQFLKSKICKGKCVIPKSDH